MNLLEELARKHKADKYQHKYTDYYSNWFEPVRKDELKILEIGVFEGASARMWAEYFPNSKIYCTDIAIGIDKRSVGCSEFIMNNLKSDRIFPHYIDQSNREDMQKFIDIYSGNFDIIIDDGHHFQKHQQISLGFLFPHLKEGGVYIIEDITIPKDRYKGMSYNDCWGISDVDNFTDTTFNVLVDFVANNKLNSPYMTDKEIK